MIKAFTTTILAVFAFSIALSVSGAGGGGGDSQPPPPPPPELLWAGVACGSSGSQVILQFDTNGGDSDYEIKQSWLTQKNRYSLESNAGGVARSIRSAQATRKTNQVLLTLSGSLSENRDYLVRYENLKNNLGGSGSGSEELFYTSQEKGFFGQYYKNKTDLGGDVSFSRVDPSVDFYWWNEEWDFFNPPGFFTWGWYLRYWDTPWGRVRRDGSDVVYKWSVRWRGFIAPQSSGNYEFNTYSDDGSDLYIGDTHVVENGGDHSSTSKSGSKYLQGGESYPLELKYHNQEDRFCLWGNCSSEARIRLRWSMPTGSSQTLTSENVKTCAYPDLAGLSQFELVSSTNASVCLPHRVAIVAKDSDGNVFSDYTGTIVLSTSSGHGKWGLAQGFGSIDNGGDEDDGSATYTFSANDNGQITLVLDNSHAETLQITVADGNVSRQTGNIVFAENTLEITSNDVAGSDIVAYRDHEFIIRYLEKDDDPNTICTTPNFNGTVNLRFYRNNSGAIASNGQAPKVNNVSIGSSLAAAGQVPISFSAGVGSVTLSTTDVGQYSMAVVDNSKAFSGSDIVGESSNFTVRPFGFYVSAASNPGAENAAGAAFKKAGETFTATIKAVGWQNEADSNYQPSGHNDSDPNNNADLANNPVLPGFGSAGESVTLSHGLVAPAGGQNGVLSGTTTIPASSFSNGVATINDLSWSEVGIVELSAQTDANFLSSGQRVIGKSGYVGRFYPDHFAISSVATPSLQNGNGSCGFTYQGQPFEFDVDPEFTITAQNANNQTTQNYTGAFWKLPSLTVDYAAPGAPAGGTTTSLSSDVTGQVINQPSNNGVSQFSANGAQFLFEPGASPGVGDAQFTTALTVSLNHGEAAIQDSDGVCYALAISCSNYVLSTDDNVAIRYGRLVLDNAQAPVTDALQMDYRAEYWTGAAFATNTLDNGSCGTSTVGTPASALVDPNRNLTLSDTSVSDTGTLVAGEGVITLTAPGADNDGQLAVTLQGPAWLQYDFDGNGTREQAQAIATFGIQKGNGPILHMREVYR